MKRKRGRNRTTSYPIWVTREQAGMVKEAMTAMAEVMEGDDRDMRLAMGVIVQARKARKRLS